MKDKTPMRKFMMVMGLAVGLPSTILGFFFILYNLVQSGYISWNALIIVLVLVISLTLGLMVKNVLGKKSK